MKTLLLKLISLNKSKKVKVERIDNVLTHTIEELLKQNEQLLKGGKQ